jgi:hypothetical protein
VIGFGGWVLDGSRPPASEVAGVGNSCVSPTEEFFALWRGIGLASPNLAIGLELATETKPEHFDPIVLAALSTGSFGEAMRQVARYKHHL